MGTGAAVHWVCAVPSQSSQKQRIPAVLQTDAGTEAPSYHRTLHRYVRMLNCSCRGLFSPQDGSNAEGGMCVCICVCRKRVAVGCSGYWTVTGCAHLHAAQHSGVGALGDGALPDLLHR